MFESYRGWGIEFHVDYDLMWSAAIWTPEDEEYQCVGFDFPSKEAAKIAAIQLIEIERKLLMVDDYFSGWDDEEHPDLGTCCACGKEDKSVRNLLCVAKKAPIPGTGWGCVICNLRPDGALAVVCDECLKIENLQLKQVILGYVTEKERIPYEDLTEDFGHNFEHDDGEPMD